MMTPCSEFPEGMCGKTIAWLLRHSDTWYSPLIREWIDLGTPKLRRSLAFKHKDAFFGLVSFAGKPDILFALTPNARP